MSGEPVFFEIGVEDPQRGMAFYGALFGWEFAPGPSQGGFTIGTPGIPGGVHGGDPGAVPYIFFRVDDMDAALDRVRELGGSVDNADLGARMVLPSTAGSSFARMIRVQPSACTNRHVRPSSSNPLCGALVSGPRDRAVKNLCPPGRPIDTHPSQEYPTTKWL
jgi:predicted enzyme related to lactoylglutathione lyase